MLYASLEQHEISLLRRQISLNDPPHLAVCLRGCSLGLATLCPNGVVHLCSASAEEELSSWEHVDGTARARCLLCVAPQDRDAVIATPEKQSRDRRSFTIINQFRRAGGKTLTTQGAFTFIIR